MKTVGEFYEFHVWMVGDSVAQQLLVKNLGLGNRAKKSLKRAGIVTVDDLLTKTRNDLMLIKNFGMTSLYEVIGELDLRGLKLSGD